MLTPKSEHVAYEILAIGFRAYPRSVFVGFAFACFIAAFMWVGLPHGFLVAWLAAIFVIALLRLRISSDFLQSRPPASELARWMRLAALGYGATGIAWGVLGAAAIYFAPTRVIYIEVIGFLIIVFAVLQSQIAAAHPMVFRAFLFGSWGPIILASALLPAPNDYVMRLVLEFLLLIVGFLAGRAGNRYVVESIVMRYENVELLQDLTRKKEALNKANDAKTHFLAAASHDLRQPMQAVVLLVESLQERITDPATRRIAANIRSSVASMAALLNAILDISKFDAGTVKPIRSHFRVANVLDRLRSSFAEQAAQRKLTLRVARSSAVIETDPILLYRILTNITTNALRYTDRGTVLIGCRRRRDGLAIEVWDTGPGIAEDDLEAIFREFHQIGNPSRDRDQGLGLGLAIVERTAQLLGHPLTVRSRVGHGSVFAVRVPYGDPAKVVEFDASRAPPWASLQGCTVLVVDDDREIRGAMQILLEGWGCKVLSAATGAEAREVLASCGAAPDVVLADYRLPGEENGIQVIRAVTAAHPKAAGILITGDIAPAIIKEAEHSGYLLLHKPLRPARLRSLLGNAWRERSAGMREAEEREPA
jgi:signal transduction histidine kinase